MRVSRVLLGAVLTALVCTAPPPTAVADSEAPTKRASLRAALETLELPDLNGDIVALSSYLGRGPILVDFWATWCKPCLKALPELDALYAEWRERGLSVVAINEDGPRNAPKVKPFMQTNGYEFPVLLDLNREAQRRLQAVALPTTLLLDADGTVLHSSFGYDPGELDRIRPLIESLLPKPEATDD